MLSCALREYSKGHIETYYFLLICIVFLAYNVDMNKSIYTYNISELPELLNYFNQPSFRAKQLATWLYRDFAQSYDEMTNLPASLRKELSSQCPLNPPVILDKQISRDGTRKYVFVFDDNTQVEAVGIPSFSKKNSKNEPKHLTVCFSTQAGCAMQCAFCATGEEGLTRNLSSGEMVAQILAVQNDFGYRVTNVVSMGQGEPFHNYDSVIDALRYLNSKDGLQIGARHITLSTCGILPGIRKLSTEPEQFTLAISLHSAIQSTRDYLMPRCSQMPLTHLKDELVTYTQKTGRRVSLEYLMIDSINDTPQHLEALVSFCDNLLCHINLIPLNHIEGSKLISSGKKTLDSWVSTLQSHGKECTIRNSRGSDIDGACGQLKNKLKL